MLRNLSVLYRHAIKISIKRSVFLVSRKLFISLFKSSYKFNPEKVCVHRFIDGYFKLKKIRASFYGLIIHSVECRCTQFLTCFSLLLLTVSVNMDVVDVPNAQILFSSSVPTIMVI